MNMRHLPRRPARLLLIPGVVLAMGLPATAGAAEPCPSNPTSNPAAETLRLLNAERAKVHAVALRSNAKLARAARAHSRDMVSHGYFSHNSRSGAKFNARIAHAGWMRGRSRWRVGENLAWGPGCAAGPPAIVNAWMHSPPHRKILLDGAFRSVGIGVVSGTPAPNGQAGLTYTADFGT
jgi:uncharacterized protein YkwD